MGRRGATTDGNNRSHRFIRFSDGNGDAGGHVQCFGRYEMSLCMLSQVRDECVDFWCRRRLQAYIYSNSVEMSTYINTRLRVLVQGLNVW